MWQQVGDIFIVSYFKEFSFEQTTIYIHPKFFSKTHVSLRPSKLNTFPSLKGKKQQYCLHACVLASDRLSSLPFSGALLRFFGALPPPTVHWQD